jgi:chemotaxis signal transduction protein
MSNQTAMRRKDKSASAVVEICSVRLGQSLYGMPISHILEIVGADAAIP